VEIDWQALSDSSKKALQFAWAAAQERTDLLPPSAEVDSWDLLIGILLSHPGDSEAEQAFRHFGLVAGQALPDGYPQLTPDGLNRRLSAMPPDQVPPLGEAQNIVGAAVSFGISASASGIVELRSLWAALLEDSTCAASSRIRDLLTQRGVNATLLASQTRAWANQGGQARYQQILESFRAGSVDVINYKADQSYRGDATQDLPSDDFVGISAEVDAFAYLIASRSLEPPLAVGLFGDWGSGKSFFLDAIRRRIDQLIELEEIQSKPQRDIPFWKRIVQVDFNAWHYVEGDLWSSLVDHIFTQLNLASEKITDNEVAKRQRYYLHQLETTSESLKRLENKKAEVERELKQRRKRVEELEKSRDKALKELQSTQTEKIVASEIKSSRGAVVAALMSLKLDGEGEHITFGGALDSLASARAELEQGRSLLRPILANPKLTRRLLVFVVLGALIPIVYLVQKVTASAIVASFAGLAALLATAAKALGTSTQWVRARLDEIDKARQEVIRELETAESTWRRRLDAAEQRVRETSNGLDELKREEAQLQEEVEKITQALEKRPPEILYEFLRDRLEAGEYRKRLGVPAIIRRDFKSLTDLISHQNMFLLATDEQRVQIRDASDQELLAETDSRIINRIVLYIDDLDRCPDAKVIEVLQAVHLLLAFPLFVVVVAVDARWLAHALRSRYPALAGLASGNDKTTAQPDDYLEKIFQVPFWVRDLDSASRTRIVHGLLGGHVFIESSPVVLREVDLVRLGVEEGKVLREMIEPRSGPPLLNSAALTVTRDELAFLDRLAPLMGQTPRSIKRFVNVYQLVKILRHSRTPTIGGPPSDDEIAAFLLAVGEGLPQLGWRMLDEVANNPSQTLSAILTKPIFTCYAAEFKRLKEWLMDSRNATWNGVPSDRLNAVASDVRRFLFRIDPELESSTTVARPQLVHVIQER
jgi:peptidoglycan hydrolase CwlO-like protein